MTPSPLLRYARMDADVPAPIPRFNDGGMKVPPFGGLAAWLAEIDRQARLMRPSQRLYKRLDRTCPVRSRPYASGPARTGLRSPIWCADCCWTKDSAWHHLCGHFPRTGRAWCCNMGWMPCPTGGLARRLGRAPAKDSTLNHSREGPAAGLGPARRRDAGLAHATGEAPGWSGARPGTMAKRHAEVEQGKSAGKSDMSLASRS